MVGLSLYRLLYTRSSLHWNPGLHETLQLRDGPLSPLTLGIPNTPFLHLAIDVQLFTSVQPWSIWRMETVLLRLNELWAERSSLLWGGAWGCARQKTLLYSLVKRRRNERVSPYEVIRRLHTGPHSRYASPAFLFTSFYVRRLDALLRASGMAGGVRRCCPRVTAGVSGSGRPGPCPAVRPYVAQCDSKEPH